VTDNTGVLCSCTLNDELYWLWREIVLTSTSCEKNIWIHSRSSCCDECDSRFGRNAGKSHPACLPEYKSGCTEPCRLFSFNNSQMFDSENVAGEGLGSVPCYGPVLPVYVRTVVLNLFSTAPPLRNCPLCQAPLKTKNLCKQMYLSVNLLMKLSMLHSAQGVAPPWNLLTPPWGGAPPRLRTTVLEESALFRMCVTWRCLLSYSSAAESRGAASSYYLRFSGCRRCHANGRSQNVLLILNHKKCTIKARAPFASVLKSFSSGAVYEFATKVYFLSSITAFAKLMQKSRYHCELYHGHWEGGCPLDFENFTKKRLFS